MTPVKFSFITKVTAICALLASFLQGHAQLSHEVIQTHSEVRLIPEGIAVDSRTGMIYVSSIAQHTIIAVDNKGGHKQFIANSQHGYLEGLGMKVDQKRNLLWTLSNKKEGNNYISKLMAFDLQTAKPRYEFTETDTTRRLFNDLTLDSSGVVYFTDMYYSAVYKAVPGDNKFTLIAKGGKLSYPNGISNHNNQLYIATYGQGPVRIDLKTNTLFHINGYADTAIAHGLDGLIYWNNSLIGVYNIGNRSSHAIVQYILNETGDGIVEERILDKGNPLFKEPTTIDIAGDTLFVLANSHLADYNENKESVKGIERVLSPVTILKYKLKR